MTGQLHRRSAQAPPSYRYPHAITFASPALVATDAEGTDTSEHVLQVVEGGAFDAVGSFGLSGPTYGGAYVVGLAGSAHGPFTVVGDYVKVSDVPFFGDNPHGSGFILTFRDREAATASLAETFTCGFGC